MEQNSSFGMNKTGIQMSPLDIEEMLAGTQHTVPSTEGDESALAEVRSAYIAESDGVGSVPMPGTVKGMLSSGMQMLTGNSPQVLIDKLGERLAFERSGTRLYDALLIKCQAAPAELGPISIETLRHFRNEEADHFRMVAEAIESLGGDPTAQTPSADVNGVESMGLMQVLNDPRTSVLQSLHAVLTAELVDNAGWELLIDLAGEMGQKDIASRFQQALSEESVHLAQIRAWYEQMTLGLAH